MDIMGFDELTNGQTLFHATPIGGQNEKIRINTEAVLGINAGKTLGRTTTFLFGIKKPPRLELFGGLVLRQKYF